MIKFRTIIFSLQMLLFLAIVKAQQPVMPKYEYRAVWLTAIENLDWPVTLAVSPSSEQIQKQDLVHILDSLQSMNVNTVLLQTRVRGDLIYPSSLEPFSHLFTGVEGKSPGYDPLAFAIEECHRRGMQLHAWIVTMPLGKDEHVRMLGGKALPKRNRSICTHYDGAWYMEPGNPATSEYIVSIVKDIVGKYDVDGIHLDYIRYPDSNDGYPDASLYRKYGKGLSLAAWRRSNITRIVKDVYTCVKSMKPWVRVSCATLGKYDNLTRYSSSGWDAMNTGFQDAQQWMHDGIVDIVFPMLYFKGKNFYPFVRDWQENSFGRHLVPGIGAYRLLPEYGGWDNVELFRQINTSRSAGTAGTALFRTAHLLGCASTVYESVYRTPALVPPMEWYGTAPASPTSLQLSVDASSFVLQWNAVASTDGEPAMRYNVYGCAGDSVDVANPENLLACLLAETSYVWHHSSAGTFAFAVTAVDAYGVESNPVKVVYSSGNVAGKDILLPTFTSWGHKMEVLDVYGRRLYFGGCAKRVGVSGLHHGWYMLKVYDRHGALFYSHPFVRP